MARGEKKTNDALNSASEAIKRQRKELSDLNAMFSDLGDNIKNQLNAALFVTDNLGESTENVAKTYRDDIAKSLQNNARDINAAVSLQEKMKTGANVEK